MAEVIAPLEPTLLTMSAPNLVRLLVYPGAGKAGVSFDAYPAVGEVNAWCLLDSVRLAYEKAGRSVPIRIRVALAALREP